MTVLPPGCPQCTQSDDLRALKFQELVLSLPFPKPSTTPTCLVLDLQHLLARMLSPRTFFLIKRNPSSGSTGSWCICHVLSLTEVRHPPAGTQVGVSTFRTFAQQERWSSKPREELRLSWVHECFIIVLLSSYPHAKQVRTSLLSCGDGCLQETHGSY